MAKRGNFFIRLCYGYVGRYKDTSKMTTKEVIEEFLKSQGANSPREFFENKFKGEYQKSSNLGDNMSNEKIEIFLRELSKKYTFSKMRKSGIQDDGLKEILYERRFLKTPKRVSKKQFIEELTNGKIVYRGVSSPDYVNEFYNGSCFVGQGFFGNGIYMSYDKNEALSYSNNLIVCVVPRDFKFAPPELKEEHKKFILQWERKNLNREDLDAEMLKILENEYNCIRDFGKFCALKGYDGYITQKGKNIVVLNRGKLVIGENNEHESILEFN